MNKDWDSAIAFVLKMEGSYTLDPNDPGGETKFGISKKAYPSLDIANLTEEQAKEIYLRDYWNPCSCDELPPALAICVFDTAVNQGITKAKRILQISLDVTVDGVIGDKTVAAAFKANSYHVKKFLANRMSEYMRLINANPSLMVFAINWSYRVISLADLVLHGGNNAGT
jgi:lysozyme family protein